MAWKASTYFKMQYITAAMISNHVPRDEARIAELGIGTGKNLYYYPDGTILVYGIDEDANPGLLERTSIAAGVPVQAVAASAYQTGLRDASVDAVVSTGAMGISGNMRGCVLESLRILKPGRPLIFVESMSGPAKEIPDIVRNEGGFQRVEIDEEWERSRWAPHAVGVAWKQEEVFSPASDNARRVEKVEKAIGKGGRKKRR